MGARFYDSALGRWLSADTIVPDSNHPQDFNRYSYVRNHPLRYIDPSGHCAGTPGEGKDDDCWQAYFQARGILGDGFGFLSQWGLTGLRNLLAWVNQGVRFTSDVGQTWTDANVKDVLSALDRVSVALGSVTQKALGLVGGGTLTFNKIGTGLSTFKAPSNTINMHFGKPIREHDVETVIHEMGHTVDWHVRPENSQWGWSGSTTEWQDATGWRRHYEHGFWYTGDTKMMSGAPTKYALTDPGQDFADTVTWYVESLNPSSGGFSRALRRPNDERLAALGVALDGLR